MVVARSFVGFATTKCSLGAARAPGWGPGWTRDAPPPAPGCGRSLSGGQRRGTASCPFPAAAGGQEGAEGAPRRPFAGREDGAHPAPAAKLSPCLPTPTRGRGTGAPRLGAVRGGGGHPSSAAAGCSRTSAAGAGGFGSPVGAPSPRAARRSRPARGRCPRSLALPAPRRVRAGVPRGAQLRFPYELIKLGGCEKQHLNCTPPGAHPSAPGVCRPRRHWPLSGRGRAPFWGAGDVPHLGTGSFPSQTPSFP